MNVISLRDYAKLHNITYEAVRQQVARYREELGEHIVIDGRQQFLDEAAVAFLDTKREKNPVVIQNDDIRAELDETKTALERLKFEYAKKEGQIELLKQQLAANFGAAERLEAAERKAAALERQAIDARKRELETAAALEKAESKVEEAKEITQVLIDQANKAKIDAEAAEKRAKEAGDRELEAEFTREKAKKEAAELKAKYEKFEAAMEEYSKLPAWKRLFVKPPKADKE